MAYTDYDFYKDVYMGDQISSGDFPRLAERASDYISAMTHGISDRVSGKDMEAVKKATCAIAEIVQDESRMTGKAFSAGQVVSSESVGSWSKTYASAALSSNEIEYIENRKKNALILYLGNIPAFAEIFHVRSFRCIHANRWW